ncbi:MAG: hypothetical protein CL897_05925 [Dehalococcoidia bacterium]|nr:hypothetical protein [Dehalococcoidia bacterium]|tara:strand:+ start:7237 stop:7971 length:735 start_codon:yes stop_codon:yes gene_type:complete
MSSPLIIAHATAAGERPANTLAGVGASLASADAMEIDLRLCADGFPVLLHDDFLDRTTNLDGPVREVPFVDLARADAGGGEHVPSLAEVLDLVSGRITVMCELKVAPEHPEEGEALLEATLEAIHSHRAESWVALHSFDHSLVERARSLAPRIDTAAIVSSTEAGSLNGLCDRAAQQGVGAISLFHAAVGRESVEMVRSRGMRLWAWTADTPHDWGRLSKSGVDGIITNQPYALRVWTQSQASA